MNLPRFARCWLLKREIDRGVPDNELPERNAPRPLSAECGGRDGRDH